MTAPRPYSGIIQQPSGAAPPLPGSGGGPTATHSGGSRIVTGAGDTSLATWSDVESQPLTITTAIGQVSGQGGDDATKRLHEVWLRISWGTSDGQKTAIFPAGGKIELVARTISVFAFFRRPDGIAVVPTFQCPITGWIARGSTHVPTRWELPKWAAVGEGVLGLAPWGLVSSAPATLRALWGTNTTANEGTLLVYDCSVGADDAIHFSAHNLAVCCYAIVAPGGSFAIEPNHGRPFFNGILWVVSSTRQTITLDPTALWRVDAELQDA